MPAQVEAAAAIESVAGIEAVVGMEVHAELLTHSKMFCGCSTQFGASPNTQCCPVCLGLPGSLPVPNRLAVEHVLRTALALNCEINHHSIFHRKNYFYPDLPKAYQISQYDIPIGLDGHVDVLVNGETRRVRIRRVHLEEDTGKLVHVIPGTSDVDYNRSGVPLMEVAHDYRYFPEPDLVPVAFDDAWIDSARASLPELPEARRRRFVEQYGLPDYDAAVLTAERAMAEYVDAAMRAHPDTKAVSNWLMGDFMRLLKSEELTIEQLNLRPAQIGEMLQLIEKGVISGKIAKTVFEELFRTGKPPAQIVQEQGLTQISDESALTAAIDQAMAEQADVVAKI